MVSSRAISEEHPIRNRRVLLAEDDAEMREMLAQALRESGIIVEVASDGRELRERLDRMSRSNAPAVVVSDVRMPGWTGLAALRWMSRNMPEIPVLIITAFGDPRTHEQARALGAVAVIDKPFDLAVLGRAVRELIETDEACTPTLRGA